MVRRRLASSGLALVLLAACTASPTPLPTTSPTAEKSTQPEATPSQPADSVAPSPSWLTGTLDQKYTTRFEEFRSTGTFVIWSTTARASGLWAPDLYGFQPGGQAELLYDNPNRETSLSPITGYGSRFAFVESKPEGMIAGPWKLWYLPAPGAEPTLVDHGSGNTPFVAMSDTYLVWTIGQGDTATSFLKVLDLTTMKQRIVEKQPRDVAVFWRPALDGNHLVYVEVHSGHVYYRDLTSSAPPVRLDASPCAGDVGIHADDVVWSECAAEGHEGGSLIHYSLATHALNPLAMPTLGDLGFTQVSVGTRYVAAWAFTDRMLYLADLQTGTYPVILDMGPTNDDPHPAVGEPDVSGDLLAYVYWAGPDDAQLRWVVLR